ncbi:hypothetical protein E2C01_100247 [Portunus trituberculatus]|uniref:Uncharacterized protein n=1 Tax=Portunus trituberculatus TaxID=210409 RepID=A0A5B7K7J2_PORTR|nr:hypothetical protein [Portunus trituberculatus]
MCSHALPAPMNLSLLIWIYKHTQTSFPSTSPVLYPSFTCSSPFPFPVHLAKQHLFASSPVQYLEGSPVFNYKTTPSSSSSSSFFQVRLRVALPETLWEHSRGTPSLHTRFQDTEGRRGGTRHSYHHHDHHHPAQ